MAKSSDAGIGEGGNWVKTEQLVESSIPFEITNAVTRPANGNFPEQVVFSIRYLYIGDDEIYQYSLSNNIVRQKYVDWFKVNTEPLNGVNEERGYVAYLGQVGKNGGNRPVYFRDASDDEIDAAMRSSDNEIPF